MAGISITLGGHFGKLDELKSKVSKTAASMRGAFAGIGKSMSFGVAGISTGAVFTGLAASMKPAIDAGGELNDLMGRTGADGRNLTILQQAFKNAGVEGDKVGSVINRMQKALAGVNEDGESTADAFSKLGLSARELGSMDAVDAFREISAAIGAIPDPARRAQAAMELFGKSGGELLAVMTDSKAWNFAEKQVGDLGTVLSENAAAMDELGDTISGFGSVAKEVGASMAAELVPVLQKVADLMLGIRSQPGQIYMPRFDSQAVRDALGSFGDQAFADSQNKRLGIQNAGFWRRKEQEKQDAIAKAAEKARTEQEKAAVAAAKKAEEVAKSKAEALDEYKLEAQIVQARIQGNDEVLAQLEREKRIRAEMAKLVTAGFSSADAHTGAALMIDKTAQAEAAETARKSGMPSGGMGAFAQSMNVLFGRSANDGLLSESMRQTKLLQKLVDRAPKKPEPVKIQVQPVFNS